MGDDAAYAQRMRAFSNYRIDGDVLAAAKEDAIVLHCLPAHRGQEITNEVMDGPQSAIFDQAENRLHAHKALLLKLPL
jgi:ornithine carbamoyltransferase